MRLSLDRFIIITLVYQILIVSFYNKAAKLFTYINKIASLLSFLVLIYFVKIGKIQDSSNLNYLIPIILTSLLLLIYNTNKGFAQHSLCNKFFPTLMAFIVLITNFISIEILNYALILSASYDFLITTEHKEVGLHKKYLGPIFILSTQLLGVLFNFGVENDMLFAIYWIIVSRLFPFSMLRDDSTSIDEHYISRSILILSLAFGNLSFSITAIILLFGSLIISLLMMYFWKTETQSFISYRAIVMSTIILLYIVSDRINDGFSILSILWIDFYFMGLAFSRLSTRIPERISQKIGNAIFFLLISGVLFGATHLILQQGLKTLFLRGQINIAIIMLILLILSAAFFFSRTDYKSLMAQKIRKFDHFDTFISELIIMIGVILSV